ncbi:MAG: CinA family nicotinamide mononucleotide deamidase-related protein [Arenicellales bacterium]|nr:CinA family nicotinamide mononucleotide deamidase-related protein [Arenicellales bacterium]
MQIEILCTGDEILTGKTVNTNYSHIARRLGEVGLAVVWGTTVGDDRIRLAAAFRQASKRADAVIVNGGLGPTVDDLSQEIAAEVAGVELELRDDWLQRIQKYYSSRGREMPTTNRKQAMLPIGSEIIDNPIGTACGFALTINKARFFFTPGVPREMKRMVDEQVIPRLLAISGVNVVTRLKRFHSFGIGESRADQLLHGIIDTGAEESIKLGFQSHYPQLETKLVLQGHSVKELQQRLAPVEAAVRERLGNFIVAEDEQTLEQRIVDVLRSSGSTLATMEMFTGGSIAARLLPLTGTEGLIKRGVVSRDLNQLIDAAGIVAGSVNSELNRITAVALADGLRNKTGSSHALVVLIALDEDAHGKIFAGNIFIGIADQVGSTSRLARMRGSREWIRLGAVEMGLDCLRRYLFGLPVDEPIDFEERL